MVQSVHRLALSETPRSFAFCAHAIGAPNRPLLVPDTLADKRFADNPLVTGGPGVRSYAGMPIVSADGYALGAICVMDQVPRQLTALQLDALSVAARLIMTLIDQRSSNAKISRAQQAKVAAEQSHRATLDYLNTVEDERIRVANALHAESSRRAHVSQELEYSRTHDALTTLPNRRQFVALLATASERLHGGLSPQRPFALFAIDIDHCKQINAALGNEIGDELLVQCAERLLAVARPDDVVARLDGDSFAILAYDVATVSGAAELARKIRVSFQAPWHLGPTDRVVTSSVGIVLSGDRYEPAEQMLRDANIALDYSKEHGRDRYSLFEPALGAMFASKVELDQMLALAFADREFQLVYQPIVSVAGGGRRLEGFEALMRWERRDGMRVSPAAFIPAAEQSGLIVPLGAWAFKTACLALHHWGRAARSPNGSVKMSVNVSAIQLGSAHFGSAIRDIIRETDVDPRNLVVEVTESAAMSDPERSLNVLRELREIGIGIHVDDFGTGYSSLSYLRRLPVTRVKIDRSFVSADGAAELVDPVIVGAIISLAHQLNLKVIAEGVETLTQWCALSDLGCDSVQGYYISRPIAAAEAAAFIQSTRRMEIGANTEIAARSIAELKTAI